jgi:triosephosphate isomerase
VDARVPVVGGNWKMHTDRAQAHALLDVLRAELGAIEGVGVVVFPPAPWIGMAADVLAGSRIEVGVQHVHWEPQGAYTGEVSASLLKGTAGWAIVGHSERRIGFGETDQETNLRLRAVLDAGLKAILAVGEQRAERESGETQDVLRRQLLTAFEGIDPLPPDFVIAYEPVWAIGTGLAATPEMAAEACAEIRGLVAARYGQEAASSVRIQYGGSVNAQNVDGLARQPDIDGALVGGASLDASQFAAICRAMAEAKRAAHA